MPIKNIKTRFAISIIRQEIISAIILFLLFPAQSAFAGSIVAWGYNLYGQSNIPSPNTGFVAVAGGGYHSLALKQDGSVVAWGWNADHGQCNVPSPNTDFKAISAGVAHSLGLNQNGSVVLWGDNSFGRLNIPPPNTGFIDVSAGWAHTLALKQDGSIVAWGYNLYGQSNIPSPNTGFVAVAGGGYHSLGLKNDGSIIAWERNDYGQCNIPSPNTGFIAIAAGVFHSLGLKADGSIVAWGAGRPGQSGWPHVGQCNIPQPNSGFVAVAAGGYHSLGLKNDGSIVAWGWNDDRQCNIPPPNTGFVAIAAGGRHSLALKAEGADIEILLPHDNGEFYSGGSMKIEVKLSGNAGASSIRFEGKIDPEQNPPALPFQKFSDDGKTLGDTTAGDGIYTSEIGLPKLTTGTHALKVTAYLTTPSETKSVSDSVTFMVTGRPVGAPTVTVDVTPQNDVLIYKNDPVTITAQVSYPEPSILPEKVYAKIYSGGKEIDRFELPRSGDVYTKTYIFTQPGPYQVDAIAEAPPGSGYAQSADSKGVYVHIDTLKVSLHIEPGSPSGIYLSNTVMTFVARVSTERGSPLPERVYVGGHVRLPDGTTTGELTFCGGFAGIWQFSYIPRMTGDYLLWAEATAPYYARDVGGPALPFEVAEGLPAKLSDELKRIYEEEWIWNFLFLPMRDEGSKLASDGDFLYGKIPEKHNDLYYGVCFGVLDAVFRSPEKLELASWFVEFIKSGTFGWEQDRLVNALAEYTKKTVDGKPLQRIYNEYEEQKFRSTSLGIMDALETLDRNLYPMLPSTEEFYVNDLRLRNAANSFLYGRALCKYDVVHHLRKELDYQENPFFDIALNGGIALLTVAFPPGGIAAGLIETGISANQDLLEMQKAEQGFTMGFEAVCALHTEAQAVKNNLLDFVSEVKDYTTHIIPEGKITLVDAYPYSDLPDLQEFMEGRLDSGIYCIETSWTRLLIKNTGLVAAMFSVNGTFSDAHGVMHLVWLMKDLTKGTPCSAVFLAPGEERLVNLYFVASDPVPFFNYIQNSPVDYKQFLGPFPEIRKAFYTNTKVPINYDLVATVTGNELYLVHNVTNVYDPIEFHQTSGYTSASAWQMVGETALFPGQEAEPNSYRMAPYPIWNILTKRSIAKPYAYRDWITISNPWPLALAVTVTQPINARIVIQSIGDAGVVDVNEIVWQVELHPHQTKTLTYDFAVVGAKVPQSGFIAVPPATMSIYDSLTDIEARFESGNTRLRVWEEMPADFDASKDINLPDLSVFCYYWLEQDCNQPDWCGGTDLDNKGAVDFNDFAIFAKNWGWTKILADIDADGDIDLSDYAILANQWEEAPGFPSADVTPDNGDGIVDFWDLAMIADYWLESSTP